MTTPEALAALGATPNLLSLSEKQSLDHDGYLQLPNILSPHQVAAFRNRLDHLAASEGENAGKEVHQEAGTARLANLVDKDPLFQICFSHPKVLAGVAHVLAGDLKLSSLNSRAALPGQGLQQLHADWGKPVEPGNYQVCNSIWLIDDFTPDNGATRAVPGSHRWGKMPADLMPDPAADHPDQKLFIAPAGTVYIFNSHTWHGGTLNRSPHPRRAVHAYFCRRNQTQQLVQKNFLAPATIATLSPAQRHLLDV